MNHTTIEGKAAQTILQTPTEVVVGGRTYQAAPPSLATLILVSEEIAQLPYYQFNEERVIEEALSVAKDCRKIAEITAILILGAKGVRTQRKVAYSQEKRTLRAFINRIMRKDIKQAQDPMEELVEEILDLSPREIFNLLSQLLGRMQADDFFGITTFLNDINLLRPTKVES